MPGGGHSSAFCFRSRVNRIRNQLVLAFLAATLVPLAAILWMSTALLEYSLSYASTGELDRLSKSLEGVAREYYRQAREDLKAGATAGRLAATVYESGARTDWPPYVQHFWDSGEPERFQLSEPDGGRLNYLVRGDGGIRAYTRSLNGVHMSELAGQIRQARDQVDNLRRRDLRRGFTYTLILLSTIIWCLAMISIYYLANRISRPVQELTAGLFQLAGGDFEVRLRPGRRDEIGRAIEAFNHTAGRLRQNRDRLVYLAQIASWQTLARKMAHELKNSLTPIRLTVEEMLARQPAADRPFMEQAAQVVVDEIESLERRVRAFSEFAAEPAARPSALDLNSMLAERIQFLQVAHADVSYRLDPAADLPHAWADGDQVKGILTNLLENAAQAAPPGGQILSLTGIEQGRIMVEVHDNGPGLSAEARGSLFEPSISFKKHGMGLGLSIARRNALLAGGDLLAIDSRLGGAGFRLLLPRAENAQA